MYNFLAERLIYPLGDFAIGTSVIKYFYWMQKTQWWSLEQLREFQNTKLRFLVKHAYENVPYYRRVFDERGLTNKDIQNTDDLAKLPILTKEAIRQNLQTLCAKDFKKWKPIPSATGGSTGEPLKYYITKDSASINWAGAFRGWTWAGYRIGDKRVSFSGSSIVPNQLPSLFTIIRRKLERNLPLSAVSMNELKYDKYIHMMRKYKPKFLNSYPHAMYLLADYCMTKRIDDIEINAVFSTGEMLLPHYREKVQKQFNCDVYDQYGSYDGGGQAMECSVHKGFHISVEKVVMEVLDEHGQELPYGKSGRIIVTDLNNYAMPFIRYDVGDMGILDDKQCNCGRGLPLLKAIEGRTTDIIKLSNGITLSGCVLDELIAQCHVKYHQLVQIAKDELLVRVVKDHGYTESETEHFMGGLRYHAGNGIKIRLEFCDKIPAGSNSKYRYIISNISRQIQ